MTSLGHTHTHDLQPSLWVCRFAHLIREHGNVIDVACGTGRHAKWLAKLGYRVEAVDRDSTALAELEHIPGIRTRIADLETPAWPYRDVQFDGVIVTNYLWRPHFDALLSMLSPDGVLIYETFMVGNEKVGRPSNPDFLLQPAELLDRVRGLLTVIAFEQGRIDLPKPAFVQRICARAGAVTLLPR